MTANQEKAAEQAARWFAWEWAAVFTQALARSASVKSRVEWATVAAQTDEPCTIWWEQTFDIGQGGAVWVGIGGVIEQAIATVPWSALLTESFSDMAWVLSARGRKDVRPEAGEQVAAPPQKSLRVALDLTLQSGPSGRIVLAFGAELMDAVTAIVSLDPPRLSGDHESSGSGRLDLLLELELPVCISFGNVQMPLQELARLGSGSIVEFNRAVDDPVHILVNDRVVASGEIVEVNGNYGVRIQSVSAQRGSICTS